MVKEFHVGDTEDASFYAGILIAAFSLSEAMTGMFWGALSDRVGRKPVLLSGLAGTIVSLLIVGFARNYWVALLGRIIGGVLNGNIGVIQTMVGELVKRPEHERKWFPSCQRSVLLANISGSSSLCRHALFLVNWHYHRAR